MAFRMSSRVSAGEPRSGSPPTACARAAAQEQVRQENAAEPGSPGGVVLPLRYRHGDLELSLFSIAAAVETATDVTVQELMIEAFYPADAATAEALRTLSAS